MRANASLIRDFTVPSGRAISSAIARCDLSSKNALRTTSSSDLGSVFMAMRSARPTSDIESDSSGGRSSVGVSDASERSASG
jgi:hypothetical protein